VVKRIVLIEPQSKEDHVYKNVRMPRLGLPLLGTQLQAAGYSVSIYMGPGSSLPWPKIVAADLAGISTTTSTSREAYRIAGFLRSRGIPVVLGGIHATFMPDEALQYADFVLRGEADLTFLPLIKALGEGTTPDDIPGVSFRRDGQAVHNPSCLQSVELDRLPIPNLTLLKLGRPLRSIPVMTSRGCPFNCTFCSVTAMFGRRYRFRSTEKVLKELAAYGRRSVFFCDDNFTANPRRSKELLQGMRDYKIGLKGWGAQVRVDAAQDDELLDLMRRSGAKIVYIGLESINPATLESYNKQQSVADIDSCVRRFHDYGIRVHGMFVFGSDSDTVQTIRDTAEFALETRIDSVQFLTLTPLPGTPLFEQLEAEGRLLTRDWELYDGHHAVFQPALMTPEQLQEETIKAFKRFYSFNHIFQNVFLTGWSTSLYRGVGWWLVRHFERQNRWYPQTLKQMRQVNPRPVPLLYRLVKGRQGSLAANLTAESVLKVYLAENKGVLYLRLRGFIDRLNLKELIRTVQGLLPRRCFHLVVNTEGLRFSSEQAALRFSRYLNRLGERVRRLQVVVSGEGEPKKNMLGKKRRRFKLPRFELLLNKR
jgi:radical SAM superfamily enzyme YgiQ (UPF0313 family)